MSHSSGIPVSTDLANVFGDARTVGGVRFVKVSIVDDQLVPVGDPYPLGASLQQDFEAVQGFLEAKIPCYILFRLDTQSMNGYDWILMAYVPDGSTVKERMVYASTRALLKRQLGSQHFADELYGSEPRDLSYAVYVDHQSKRSTPSPLTESEIQYRAESNLEVAAGVSKEYVHSVRFPLSNAAQDQLRALASNNGGVNFVQLLVDPKSETIELAGGAKKVTAAALSSEIPSAEPRFTLFRFDHEFRGAAAAPLVFVYSCPTAAHVRLKMLYSTVKSAAAGASEGAGLKIDKKIEISEPSELTADSLFSEIHGADAEEEGSPAGAPGGAKFKRPVRPGKGGARLTKK